MLLPTVRAPPEVAPGAATAWLSDDLLLLVHPFRTYRRAAAAARPGAWALLRGPLRWALVVGGFVSLTTAGRLVWYHLLLPLTVWGAFPLLQAAWVVVAARAVRADRSPSVVVDLYFRGHGPWYLLLLAIAGVCLLAPAPWPAFEWLLGSGALLAALAATTLHSTLLTYALFRAALGLGRPRALLGLGLFLLGYGGSIALWFAATGQLAPLVLEVP